MKKSGLKIEKKKKIFLGSSQKVQLSKAISYKMGTTSILINVILWSLNTIKLN